MLDRKVLLGNVAGIVCMSLWSVNFPLIVAILKTWDPVLLSPVRIGLAGCVVLLVAIAAGQLRSCVSLMRSGRYIWLSFMYGLSALLFVMGQDKVDAVSAAVILSCMPIASALLGWIEGVERPTWRLLAAIVLTVIGGTLTSLVSAQGSGSEGSLAGILLLVAGMTVYVWATRGMVLGFADMPDLAKSGVSMVLATLPLLVAAAAGLAVGVSVEYDFSSRTMIMIVAMSVVSVGLSTVLWLWTGRMVGVTVASMHHNMVPFYVIVMAAFGGAIVTGQHVIGAVLVIAGAIIAQLRPRKRKAGITQPVPAGRAPWARPRKRPGA
jgi:drug/metabolite transporter (DMT)-like permease